MTSPEALLLARAHRQHQVVSRRQLLDDGLGDLDIARWKRHGVLVRTLMPGIYGVGDEPTSLDSRTMAALLATSRSALHRATAAKALRLPMAEALSTDPVELIAPFTAGKSSPWATVHRSRHLPPIDITTTGPFATTTAERTLCDLSTLCGTTRLRTMAQKMLVEAFVTRSDLFGCASAFVRRGRPGSERLRMVLASLDDGLPIPDSMLEVLFVEQVAVPHHLPLDRQFRPPWYDGIRGIADFGSGPAQLIAEVDGRPWHSITQDARRDRQRDRLAMRHGYLPLRFTADEIRRDPAAVASEIRFHLGARAA